MKLNSLMKVFTSLLLFFLASLLFGEINGVESSHHSHRFKVRNKLFVFGDSYVDTGNTKKPETSSWRVPYGITFPGEPAGRYSDGHVSTDYLAILLRIKLPITYSKKDDVDKKRLRYGMNFAYGGTGVFDTMAKYPNMTVQISLFEHVLGNVYSQSDLSSSFALVSVAGNDYTNFLATNRPVLELPAFIKQVVNQIEVCLRRIHTLGVKKIAVPSLTPLGYIPEYANGPSIIKDIVNGLSTYHNLLLEKVVAKLNKETNHSTFVIFDYYNAFSTIFKNKGEIPGIMKFDTPFKECCKGNCGYVDPTGVRNYTLCDDPKSAFFWDGVHPTQEGWKSVYTILRKNITASLTKE